MLGHDPVFRIAATAVLFLIALDFFGSALGPGADPEAGFHVNQALILLGLYGGVATAICGAYLGGADLDWGTRPWRLTVDGRRVLWFARLLVLVALTLVGAVAAAALGSLFDLVNGYEPYPGSGLVVRVAFLWAVELFWGLVGFLIAAVQRSFAGASMIPIAWILLEPLADFRLPPDLAQVFPVWNTKIVLESLFPNRDGALAVILPAPGSATVAGWGCAIYFATAVALCLVAGLVAGLRRGQ